ncbi:VCBS repeat-containing protein [Candidatus Pacearchaeota archaeon]|nr:VCBS repeat-containing protein [Candidatus Pacearchaeota archaeon]
MRLYQRIIAGGLVVAGLAGLLGCDNDRPRTEEPKPKSVAAVELYPHGNAGVAIGDITGDKLPDLVIAAEKIIEREAVVYVSDNRGNYQFGNPTLIASVPLYGGGRELIFGGGSPGLDVALGDFDNDGDLDILVAAEKLDKKEAAIFRIENLGNNTYSNPKHVGDVPLATAGGLSIATQDINQDGRTDILVSAEHPSKREANMYFFENEGNNSFEAVK